MSLWHRRVARGVAAFVAAVLWWSAAPAASALPALPTPAGASASAHEVLAVPQEAYRAYDRWEAEGWPRARTWHVIDGEHCYSGGRFGNYENRLPPGGRYQEYDALCHPKKPADRGAKRIVADVDHDPLLGYYTGDHYETSQVM